MKKKNPLKELEIVGMTTYPESLCLFDNKPERNHYWIKNQHLLEIALGNYDFELNKKQVRTWIEPIKK